MYNIPPTKFPNDDTRYSIRDESSYGPTFGGDMILGLDLIQLIIQI